MNKKAILMFFVMVLLSLSVCSAQGLFRNSNDSEASTKDSKPSNPAHPGDTGAETSGKPEKPSHPGETGSGPIGEGLLFLTLLSGGYFFLKKKQSKDCKNEA